MREIPHRPPLMPDDSVEADVLRFVRQHHPRASVRVHLRIPEEGVVLFTSYEPVGDFGDALVRDGFRLGDRIGWLDGADDDPRSFQVRREDRFLFSLAFIQTLQDKGLRRFTWGGPFVEAILANPDTPRETLARLVETEGDLHPRLIAHPGVRTDLPMLLALHRGRHVPDDAWRLVALPVLDRAARDPATPRDVLAAMLEVLARRDSLPELGLRLVDNAAVRGDAGLLLAAARLHADAYAPVRARAIGRLAALPDPPRALWMEIGWWETNPELIRHPRVRGDVDALWRVAWVDASRFPDVVAESHRFLLARPELGAEEVSEIAAFISGNLRACRPAPYPSRELGLAALAHPASARSEAVAIALVYTYEIPELRAAAYRRLTGKALPPHARQRPSGFSDAADFLQAHTLALVAVQQRDDWRRVVDAALARMGDTPEAAEWRRVLAENRDEDALYSLVLRRDERMNRLRRHSPFLALLSAEARNGLGVACDDL